MMKAYRILSSLILASLTGYASAQMPGRTFNQEDIEDAAADTVAILYESVADSLIANFTPQIDVMSLPTLPSIAFMPSVYSEYEYPDTTPYFKPLYSGDENMRWAENAAYVNARYRSLARNHAISNPGLVMYNIEMLPDAPKEYVVKVNPEDHTIQITEAVATPDQAVALESTPVEKRHWLRTFDASLQFSQAYVSPNWYQGGNNNLNGILNINYNVKLNPAYHPNLLFESTFSYRLGMNSTPDDTLRAYNVSEDILQANTIFGIKAANKWYYSFTGQFKTQLVNSYKTNTNDLRSAFLSPGELNLGLGMTYNTANPKKTFTLDASISPVSYNMMICTNVAMNPTQYGIKEGHKTISKYGSSAECKIMWKMANNITLNSRIFSFTDYKRAYFDWENQINFEINKFLTTRLFVHLRYDTDTPVSVDPNWHKLQVKEILSLGFAYKFQTS